jgi:hypothetical protein
MLLAAGFGRVEHQDHFTLTSVPARHECLYSIPSRTASFPRRGSITANAWLQRFQE